MRLPFVGIFTLLFVNILVDLYIYLIAKKRCASPKPARTQLFTAAALYVLLGVIVLMPYRSGPNAVVMTNMWLLYSYLTIYVAKYVFVIFDLIASVPLIFKGHRMHWLSHTAVFLAAVVFLLMWWGALINRYKIDVRYVDVPVSTIPSGLNGLRIAQISDLHLGTFGCDTSFVNKLVDSINACHPDIIVFTGDIVNREATELSPFIPVLSRIHAPYGVYSILGNHDYGDYVTWKNAEDKVENLERLVELQKSMNWHLLRNETDTIVVKTDTFMMIGVENIGDPPFHVYGDLHKAYAATDDAHTKILLSHNPAHWTHQVRDNAECNIALTLSGHTHAMQMTVAGWSPCVFRYKEWGGLFKDSRRQHLYVNIGDGTVGIPARIGATPEITILTLRK